MKKWLITAFATLAFTAAGAHAEGNPESGKTKSVVCAACHGADGNSVNTLWPKLAGQHPEYIVQQLGDFKSGKRSDPLMSPQAAALSERDMDDLAAFFSSQAKKGGTSAADQVELGEKLFRAGNTNSGVPACMACHGPAGSGNPQAKFPAVSGQHADYLVKALKDFRSGTRTNDASKMMQGVAAAMTDQEITAVSQYIQGLSK
jgi:cytochrome c553